MSHGSGPSWSGDVHRILKFATSGESDPEDIRYVAETSEARGTVCAGLVALHLLFRDTQLVGKLATSDLGHVREELASEAGLLGGAVVAQVEYLWCGVLEGVAVDADGGPHAVEVSGFILVGDELPLSHTRSRPRHLVT